MTTLFISSGILIVLAQLFSSQAVDPYSIYSQLDLPAGPFGPDSVFLGQSGEGPYVGVSDGRILVYNGNNFADFAYTSPNRTKELCDGVTDIALGPRCGRPLGFAPDPVTGSIYVVGAYGGLYEVGRRGGLATLLASNASGVPFTFLNSIDLDSLRRVLYFTDSSLNYTFSDLLLGKPTPVGDSTGRLLSYNLVTKQVKVILQGLQRPAGVAVSSDFTFLLYSSRSLQQVYKYWTIGPKAGRTETLIPNLPGFPLKIKRAPEFNTFWVSVNVVVQDQPRVVNPYGYKFSSNGEILLIKNFTAQYPNSQVNVVQEYKNIFSPAQLFIGSRQATYVGNYRTR